jgi:hypothetical protein
LLVRTNQTISSNDPVGKTFAAQLANDVVVAGKVVLRAGTKAIGRIDSSRQFAFMPLILNVTQIAVALPRGGFGKANEDEEEG